MTGNNVKSQKITPDAGLYDVGLSTPATLLPLSALVCPWPKRRKSQQQVEA